MSSPAPTSSPASSPASASTYVCPGKKKLNEDLCDLRKLKNDSNTIENIKWDVISDVKLSISILPVESQEFILWRTQHAKLQYLEAKTELFERLDFPGLYNENDIKTMSDFLTKIEQLVSRKQYYWDFVTKLKNDVEGTKKAIAIRKSKDPIDKIKYFLANDRSI